MREVRESPVLMSLAMTILAVFCAGMGLLLVPSLRESVLDPAVQALMNGLGYAAVATAGM
jgi:hypothetical protein